MPKTIADKQAEWELLKRRAAEATLEKPERYPVPAVEWARRVLGASDKVTAPHGRTGRVIPNN